ncbi:VOC family protein [Vibrio sp. PP-XX7]
MNNSSRSFVSVTGISFIEFSGTEKNAFFITLLNMGLHHRAGPPRLCQDLYTQGDVHFITNLGASGHSQQFCAIHQQGVSAIAMRVENAQDAFKTAIAAGPAAKVTNYNIPAIQGVGNSLIYLVDVELETLLFSQFSYTRQNAVVSDTHLQRIDHLTHNLSIGGLERMCTFYEDIFGFVRIRSFDIEGKKTGLYSEVVASPCGQVIIPLNETKDDKSQIAEFLREYHGEGIQHIALLSSDIYSTVSQIADNGVAFQDTPDTYFERIDQRLPSHGEDVKQLGSIES